MYVITQMTSGNEYFGKPLYSPISTLRYIYLIKHKTKGFYFIVHGAFTPYLYYCCEKS